MDQHQPFRSTKQRRPESKTQGDYNNPLLNRGGWLMGNPGWAQSCFGRDFPTIIAVGGGKGGVGKSLISSNLATQLAKQGARTVIVDFDFGCANLHTYFGISHPSRCLTDYMQLPKADLTDYILHGPMPGLGIIAGGRGGGGNKEHAISHAMLQRFFNGLAQCRRHYKIDFVVFDLGAGTHNLTMELFSMAHMGIVTVLPEPTSIENAYTFLKAHLWQLVENVGTYQKNRSHKRQLQQKIEELSAARLDRGYLSLLREEFNNYPELIKGLGSAVVARKLGIIINQARNLRDRDIGSSMEGICEKFFGLPCQNLGTLNYDDAAWKALRNQRLLLLDFPHSLIVQRIRQIAQNVVDSLR